MESFLSLIRKRFEGKDNTVPWDLDDKTKAYDFVEKLNIKHANTIAVLDNIEDIKEVDLPDNFVVKISNAHSAIGVMLLESISNNKYFDHISLNEYNLDSIISSQKAIASKKKRKGAYWVVEELLINFLPNKFIPLDYKVYCFHGQPKIIVQMDRNTSPPETAIFDGTFMPLIYGKDYTLDPDRLVPGNHIIPSHPISILKTAYILSKATNDKFVRIDLYDTPSGVYFGEFTFAPGAPDVGMIRLDYEILSNFDLSIEDKAKRDINFNTNRFFQINQKKFNEAISKVDNNIDNDYHDEYQNKLLIRASDGDIRAIRKLATAFSKEQNETSDKIIKLFYQHFSLCWKMLSYYNGDKELTYNIIQDVYKKTGFIQHKKTEISMLIQECQNYFYTNGTKSWWYKIRHAQFILEFSEDDQEKKQAIDTLEYYTAQNNEFAEKILNNHNKKIKNIIKSI